MRIAFDIATMRPACPLLQAAYKCDATLADLFPTEIWLLAPTSGMRVYNIEREQVPLLVEKARKFKERIPCLTQ